MGKKTTRKQHNYPVTTLSFKLRDIYRKKIWQHWTVQVKPRTFKKRGTRIMEMFDIQYMSRQNISFILSIEAIIKTTVVNTATLMQMSREHWNLITNFYIRPQLIKVKYNYRLWFIRCTSFGANNSRRSLMSLKTPLAAPRDQTAPSTQPNQSGLNWMSSTQCHPPHTSPVGFVKGISVTFSRITSKCNTHWSELLSFNLNPTLNIIKTLSKVKL